MAEQLTRAHVFVEREGLILALRQATSLRWWECPGGNAEAGEEPATAAVREVLEETGLHLGALDLLRRWEYEDRHGRIVAAFAFAGHSPAGDVLLSSEHSDYTWLSVGEYAERYCAEVPQTAPDWTRRFLSEMRVNCQLFDSWLQRRRAK